MSALVLPVLPGNLPLDSTATCLEEMSRADEVAGGTVEFALHPRTRSATEQAGEVQALCALICAQVGAICRSEAVGGYIWQRDAFNLRVEARQELGATKAYHYLLGRVRIGVSLVDEGYIIWLLHCLSLLHPGLAISIRDSDGEPLLIEASDALLAKETSHGRWRWLRELTPENSQGRVWIIQGRLHLIPLEYRGKGKAKRSKQSWMVPDLDEDDPFAYSSRQEQAEQGLDTREAVQLLKKPDVLQEAPEVVQAAVFAQCGTYPPPKGPVQLEHVLSSKDVTRYPLLARSTFHQTVAMLPIGVRQVLTQDPNLMGPAIEAFLESEDSQLRFARKMDKFTPRPILTSHQSTLNSTLVAGSLLTPIKLTKVMYAQLDGRSFFPPKVFGADWLPIESSSQRGEADRSRYLQRALGLKIACGFEIAYQDSLARHVRRSTSDGGLARPDPRDPEFQKYLESLTRLGYFGQEIKGSQRWRELERDAGQKWTSIARDMSEELPFHMRVDHALSSAPAITLESLQDILSEDHVMESDQWLFESEGQNGSKRTKDEAIEETEMQLDEEPDPALLGDMAQNLSHLADKMNSFVERTSGLDGAEFEDEADSNDDLLGGDGASDVSGADEGTSMTEAEKEKRRNDFYASLAPSTPWGIRHDDRRGDIVARQSSVTDGTNTIADQAERQKIITELGMRMQEKEGHTGDSDEINAIVETESTFPKPLTSQDDLEDLKISLKHDIEVETDPYSDSDWEDDEDVNPDFRALADEGLSRDDIERLDKDNLPDFDAEDFLDFTRQALGLDQAQFDDIIRTRRDQGRYVPDKVKSQISSRGPDHFVPPPSAGSTANTVQPLGTFDEVMAAMDDELSKHEQLRSFSSARQTDGVNDGDGVEDINNEEAMDYNLIKNLLESFQSQGRESGPAEVLAARLGHRLPRGS